MPRRAQQYVNDITEPRSISMSIILLTKVDSQFTEEKEKTDTIKEGILYGNTVFNNPIFRYIPRKCNQIQQ